MVTRTTVGLLSCWLAAAGCSLDRTGLGGEADAMARADGGRALDGAAADTGRLADGETPPDVGATDADAFDPCVDAPLPDTFVLCPFGAPRLIAALSSPATDDDPTLTSDRLELYFDSRRPGGLGGGDVWVSRRTSVGDPWSAPTLVAELSSPMGETTPEVSADGLTMWLSSDRRGAASGSYDTWIATRPSRASAWGTPVVVPGLSTPERDVAATPSRDGLEVTVSQRPPSGGDWNLWYATRASTADPWGTLAPIVELNSTRPELDGYFDASGLHLFYDGDLGAGTGRDIVLSMRTGRGSPFGPAAEIPGVNSPEGEEDPWISDDLRYLVFASRRGGDMEIYETSR